MVAEKKLSREQRRFFTLVARAGFSSPFGEERLRLDRKIADVGNRYVGAVLLERVTAKVRDELGLLESGSRFDLRRFCLRDRRILRVGLLFDLYHRFLPQLDDHIREQLVAGDEPVPVPFAAELLARFSDCGFSKTEALRYLAFFYQLRRAFYFIAEGLIGCSPCMVELRRHLWNNIFTADIRWYEQFLWNQMEDFSTLLLGDTGCGKGAAAAAIGRSGYIPFDEKRGRFSESFARNFLAINLSQFPENLIESELFGHRKGAFTGAVEQHQGVFARCSPHGAIFLDEIGDVSVPVQIKLLQVLQERSFAPVGSHQRQRFSGRVIAATNRPLGALRDTGVFRDDFYYRLCSDVIHVPSLRQRLTEDRRELGLLLHQVVRRSIGETSSELVDWLEFELGRQLPDNYAWPGNVRELEQAIRRLVLNRRYVGESRPAKLPDPTFSAKLEEGQMSAAELLAGYCAQLYARCGTYEEVARITGLDRRTAKKYVLAGATADAG